MEEEEPEPVWRVGVVPAKLTEQSCLLKWELQARVPEAKGRLDKQRLYAKWHLETLKWIHPV